MNNEIKLAYAYFAKFIFENHDNLIVYCINRSEEYIEIDVLNKAYDSCVINVQPANGFYSIYYCEDSTPFCKYYKKHESLEDLIHDFEEKVL